MKRLIPPTVVCLGAFFFLWLFRLSQSYEKPQKTPPPIPTAEEIQAAAANFRFEIGKYGGTLNDWIDMDMKDLNYAISNDAQTSSVLYGGGVFQTLFKQDSVTLDWLPQLAAEVPVTSADPGGLIYIVKLRRDVVWHDGAPFNADDMIFSFDDITMNESIPVPGRVNFFFDVKDENGKMVKKPLRVEKVDDYTLRFIFPVRNAIFQQMMNLVAFPRHILKPRVDDGSFTSTWNVSTPPAQVIGTGPFMPSEYVPGERFILKRNPNYYEKDAAGNRLPYLDRIVFNIIRDQNTQKERFLLKQLDYLEVRPMDYAEIVQKQEKIGYDIVHMGPRTSYGYIALNQNPRSKPDGTPYVKPWKSKWFRDLRFRQALAHCIDKESIIQLAYDGFATSVWVPYTPKYQKYYLKDGHQYPFEPETAGKLLDDMGLIDRNGDGIRDDEGGEDRNGDGKIGPDEHYPVEFILTAPATIDEYKKLMAIVEKDMLKVGIRMIPEFVDFNLMLRKINSDWDFEAVMLGQGASMEALLAKAVFTSTEPRRIWNPKTPPGSAENRPWEVRLDELFREAYTSWNEKEKRFNWEKDVELAHEWQRICADNLPQIYTTVRLQVYAFHREVRNRRSTLNRPYDIERLYIQR